MLLVDSEKLLAEEKYGSPWAIGQTHMPIGRLALLGGGFAQEDSTEDKSNCQ